MTASQHNRGHATATNGVTLGRVVRRAAVALRALHDEQVLMRELPWQAGRVRVDGDGPLAWVPSRDGPRLTGGRLPSPDQASAEGRS
jgi:hypothetical protein